MSAARHHIWTEAAYLQFERASAGDAKHEFHDGNVYVMVGASPNHNLIVGNTLASIHAQIRNRPCYVYPSDLRMKISETGLYTYPDLSVVCGEPQFSDDQRDTLLNPTLLIEVLSPSTETYDRGKKFQHYRTLKSLQEYILIAQDTPHIERYLRRENGEWLLTDAVGLDAVMELTSIQSQLALADVYEKLDFGEDAS